MKIFLIAFVASLSLLTVNAGLLPSFHSPLIDAAVHHYKTANCVVQNTLEVQNVAQNFLDEIVGCGTNVSEEWFAIIDACVAIIETCQKIIRLHESTCSDIKNPSTICVLLFSKDVAVLKKQADTAATLFKQLEELPHVTTLCGGTAVNHVSDYFTQFSANVGICAN
ncbi:uncharacterized protein LOC119671742 [Teleopsis dalmanni]|uniref:uncharacterized protein LOC119670236 n=1 Tax=Teleopsis dalmanni TaxID=139649 RepID=UPI0018CDC271|nr:uncharacterized protein LOC119670236 [Teleopsis dalmanni]XP_037938434.1 uncharacterized protein LOC119671742 [Teleopsis dalmanni]